MTATISEIGLALVMIPIAIFFCIFAIGAVWCMLKLTVESYREHNMTQLFVVLIGWLIIGGVALMFIGAVL